MIRRKNQFAISGLMIAIAYIALALAYPLLLLMTLGGLAMLVGSVLAASLIASPALLISWLIAARKPRNGAP